MDPGNGPNKLGSIVPARPCNDIHIQSNNVPVSPAGPVGPVGPIKLQSGNGHSIPSYSYTLPLQQSRILSLTLNVNSVEISVAKSIMLIIKCNEVSTFNP